MGEYEEGDLGNLTDGDDMLALDHAILGDMDRGHIAGVDPPRCQGCLRTSRRIKLQISIVIIVRIYSKFYLRSFVLIIFGLLKIFSMSTCLPTG